MEEYRIRVNLNKIFKGNLFFINLLLIGNCIVIYMNFLKIGSYKLITLFSFNDEYNIPTFYSAIALLFSSLVLFLISNILKNKSIDTYYWKFLSLIFLFLSIDEISEIHEWFGYSTNLGDFGPWYFYYLPFVFAIGLISLYFMKKIPFEISKLIIFSMMIFLFGCVFLEFIQNLFVTNTNDFKLNLLSNFLSTLEEYFEMIGISIFNYSLLKYINKYLLKNKSSNFSLTVK